MRRADRAALRASVATIAGLALLALIAWRVIALGVADYLASRSPERALRWYPAHGEALLAAALASASPDAAIAHAHAALHANPLQGVAYRVLAMHAGDPEAMLAGYRSAVRHAPRDLPSHARLLEHALGLGDAARAVVHVDQMLRVEPRALEALRPALILVLQQPSARDAFERMLRARPPWRTAVLLDLAKNAPDTAALSRLINAVASEGELEPRELDAWLARLIRERQWAAAYLAWADSVVGRHRSIGNVYDGGFEAEPTQTGFDWRLRSGPGVRASRAWREGASGAAALRVEFAGQRASFAPVTQLLWLPAGRYRLAGRVRSDRLRATPGVGWTIACAEGGTAIAQTQGFAGDHAWAPFALEFEVPETGCAAQWLRLHDLARAPATQVISGTLWFDDIGVGRLAEAGFADHSGVR